MIDLYLGGKNPQNGKKKFATEFKNGIHLQNMQTAAQYQENNQVKKTKK